MGQWCWCDPMYGRYGLPKRRHRKHSSRKPRHGFMIGAVRVRTPHPIQVAGMAGFATYLYPTYHPPVKGRPARNRRLAAQRARAARWRRQFREAERELAQRLALPRQ